MECEENRGRAGERELPLGERLSAVVENGTTTGKEKPREVRLTSVERGRRGMSPREADSDRSSSDGGNEAERDLDRSRAGLALRWRRRREAAGELPLRDEADASASPASG